MRCLMRKTKLQNAGYILRNASICVYVKSIIVLCNVMGFVIISGVYLLM
jgi:Trk-type K+ transport system membrane component